MSSEFFLFYHTVFCGNVNAAFPADKKEDGVGWGATAVLSQKREKRERKERVCKGREKWKRFSVPYSAYLTKEL